MAKVKKTAKTYTIIVAATVEIVASFEITANSEEDAKTLGEDSFENEIDRVISSMDGYEDCTTESIESEVVNGE